MDNKIEIQGVEKANAFIEEILGDKNVVKEVMFADAVKLPQPADTNPSAVLGLEEINAEWVVRFTPNPDTNRSVKKHSYEPEGTILKVSYSKAKGIMVTEGDYYAAFKKDLQMLEDMTQVTFLLTDGRMLVGHISKPKHGKSRIYLPMRYWPEDIAAPDTGLIQRVRVITLIIG
ncbi:MAG TPA: hypothetical protein VNY36_02985 [Bacteroidia bacterium]|jgi:hypothetical protein|nr:hypothetical protein [Bacteroidia bacterium]